MRVLGLSCGFSIGNRDTSCCLMMDGRIVSVVHEERFSRTKKSSGHPMPDRSLDWTLKEAGLRFADLDRLAVHGTTFVDHEARLRRFFERKYGSCPAIDIHEHHHCHAASSYYSSGYDESLIVTVDFVGDRNAGLAAVGRGPAIEKIEYSRFPDSLGLVYGMITQYLGFELGEDEFKVMGLAAYGDDPVDLDFLVGYDESRGYRVDLDYVFLRQDSGPPTLNQEEYYADELIDRLGPPRLKGEELKPRHANLALGLQRLLERTATRLVEDQIGRHGVARVCLAGGVALNVLMNQRIAALPGVESLFVPPFAGDDGICVGAAYLSSAAAGVRPSPLEHPYLGSSFTDQEIETVLTGVGVGHRRLTDPCTHAAQALADGEIIGWFQGASECGPRALGNRSILADPRHPDTKDRVNAAVKLREGFRPFGPSVLAEKQHEYFEAAGASPFMNVTCDVREEHRQRLPAVTHRDGTARIHTVGKATNPLYHRLISCFGDETSVYVVLNTSFNLRGEPIVDSPRDALRTFFGSGLSRLYLGPYLIEK